MIRVINVLYFRGFPTQNFSEKKILKMQNYKGQKEVDKERMKKKK